MTAEPSISRPAAIATILGFAVLVATLWLSGWREMSDALQASGKPAEQRLQAAMPFRRAAMRLWNGVRWQLTGSTPPSVVRGRDGWWFYASEHADDSHSLDELEGRVAPSPDEARWAEVVRARAALGGYLAVVPPDKQLVMQRELPFTPTPGPSGTRLSRLSQAVGAAALLDLSGAVSCGYPRSDSHWLDEGAYQGYRAIHSRLALRGDPLPRSAFTALPYDWPGDLWALRMAGPTHERVELWQAVAPLPAHWLDGSPIARPGVFHLPAAQSHWALGPLGVSEVITLVDDPTLPTAVVFHDSFMPALLPYLAQHFRRIRFVWCHYLQPVVDAEKPDIVIHENVARNVQWLGKVSDVP